ncbi:MAG: alcohol dehydrogenase GroES domain protein, L-iditol 2-dehydrogenase [Candidatus Peregrinibacteria bacterium GW2011_GWF2_33_10]|nr:MAG: alcohol dehydrogenase GroES domain protein, L-iditol 2-dehydrogenase [Candidatus Peregrinibacteria bacterium GW2011_GWF2_33_10]OGJ44224.1 MAG: hypothetical protein A2263_04590 [Candidatus Peregrinibacteria bacterium RIFOXYA2_FULL_33_21]OGJ47209.1 MAG: hypothetical protein A2272_06390 [Candidatus Peregrinibacteria bacterium RIFOXYA12_FULL_33_12]OGJ49935.1 MAG: hypothetical protein A2307_00765 [Candidatus Peregrinibacteria bacterium RIFOXYB2_FULL_33_20]
MTNNNQEPPKFMQGAVYDSHTRLWTIKNDIAIPEITANEVLLKVDLCGVCGTDRKKILYNLKSGPRIFGHEIVGTIVRTGFNVNQFQTGEKVVIFHHVPCENCEFCEQRMFAQCATYQSIDTSAGFGEPSGGGFAEYIRIPNLVVQKGIIKIPTEISWEEAVNIEPLDCALKGVQKAKINEKDTVAVIGMGFFGHLISQLCHYCKAKTIYPVDISEQRFSVPCRSPEVFLKQVEHGQHLSSPNKVFVAVANMGAILTAMQGVQPRGTVILMQDLIPENEILNRLSHHEISFNVEYKKQSENIKTKVFDSLPGTEITLHLPDVRISDDDMFLKILKLIAQKKLFVISSYSSSGTGHLAATLMFQKLVDISKIMQETRYISLANLPEIINIPGQKHVIKYD